MCVSERLCMYAHRARARTHTHTTNYRNLKKECDDFFGMHEEDSKARDEELYFLDAWIKTKVQVAKDDKAELKERKDDQADTKEDKFEPLYDRQMQLKLTTNKSALEMLEEAHKKMEAQKSREKRLLKEHKDKTDLQINALNVKFEKLDIAHKGLLREHANLKAELSDTVDERDAWQRQFVSEQELNYKLQEKTGEPPKPRPNQGADSARERVLKSMNEMKELREAAEAKDLEIQGLNGKLAELQKQLEGCLQQLEGAKVEHAQLESTIKDLQYQLLKQPTTADVGRASSNSKQELINKYEEQIEGLQKTMEEQRSTIDELRARRTASSGHSDGQIDETVVNELLEEVDLLRHSQEVLVSLATPGPRAPKPKS